MKKDIKVLGMGCKSCHALFENVKQAVAMKGIEADVEHITDIQKVAEYGVAKVPALVVDGEVVIAGKVNGKVPSPEYVAGVL